MAIKFASGRDVASTPLLEAEFPFTLDPEIYKGAWVITSSGNTFYSNGNDWISTTSAGIEVFQPPWESTPDGWFDVAAAPPGDLADRGVIASKFDVSYVTPDAQTWPIVDPANLFSDDEGTTPVLSAPEPIGLLEDTTVPQINWFQDVSVDRPQWDQITRNGETVNVLKFDNLGQELKVDFPEAVSGTMVHVTTAGVYRAEVDIPAGVYDFGRWHGWADIEEIILLDRTLTESEYTQLKNELAKTRNRVVDQDLPSDMDRAFEGRGEIVEIGSFDFSDVTLLRRAFIGTSITEIPPGFLDTATDLVETGRFNVSGAFTGTAITSIPENLFANCPNLSRVNITFSGCSNITSVPENLFANNKLNGASSLFYECSIESLPEGLLFGQTDLRDISGNTNFTNFGLGRCFGKNNFSSIPENLFRDTVNCRNFSVIFEKCYNLTSVPENLFANCAEANTFGATFIDCSLTEVPENLFANNPKVVNFGTTSLGSINGTFRGNNLTSVPENLFANNPNVTNFGHTFRDNNLTSIPENLFANTPNVTNFVGIFRANDLTSIPAGLFDNTPNVTNFEETFRLNNITTVPAGLFDTQTQCTNYDSVFEDNDLDQTSVDNVLVSVQTSADASNLNDGTLGIAAGTNATPSQTGKDAADALRARGWTVNLNGY